MIHLVQVQQLAQELNDDTVSPGLLGTAVVACLGVALVVLLRSMSKRISKIQAPRQADLDQAAWEESEAARAARASEEK